MIMVSTRIRPEIPQVFNRVLGFKTLSVIHDIRTDLNKKSPDRPSLRMPFVYRIALSDSFDHRSPPPSRLQQGIFKLPHLGIPNQQGAHPGLFGRPSPYHG